MMDDITVSLVNYGFYHQTASPNVKKKTLGKAIEERTLGEFLCLLVVLLAFSPPPFPLCQEGSQWTR